MRPGVTVAGRLLDRGETPRRRPCYRRCRLNLRKYRPRRRDNQPSRRRRNLRAIPVPRCRRRCMTRAGRRHRRNYLTRCRTSYRCAGRTVSSRPIHPPIRELHEQLARDRPCRSIILSFSISDGSACSGNAQRRRAEYDRRQRCVSDRAMKFPSTDLSARPVPSMCHGTPNDAGAC